MVELELIKCKGLAVPQAKPLSPGEVLGCTSPKINPNDFEAIMYVFSLRILISAKIFICEDIWAMDDFI